MPNAAGIRPVLWRQTTLDASCLTMPLVFFMSPTDPKMTQTLDAICRPISQGGLLSDGNVYRYDSTRSRRWPEGRRGDIQHVRLLADRGIDAGGKNRPRPP